MAHFDVLIIGSGISGIGAGYHIQKYCPGKTFQILESRGNLGGTWDFFKYPGIRSDSDMYTLGYSFRPWDQKQTIAEGPSILKYLSDTAQEFGLDKKIRYHHRVKKSSWNSKDLKWTVDVLKKSEDKETSLTFTCSFLFLCCGYYNYERCYKPKFPGQENYRGRLVHPQEWTSDIDYAGKKVVVIGSGATAITLIPSMAETASHVTMLQRSPSYVITLPNQDPIAQILKSFLPLDYASVLIRFKNVFLGSLFFQVSRFFPNFTRSLIQRGVQKHLGPEYDYQHFTPRYNPWDQRVCIVPNADLFHSLRDGKSSIVTAEIENFTENGILLKNGQELEADLIISATGLELLPLGGIEFFVDGEKLDISTKMLYKGCMLSDVPNCAAVLGYTNASWTLKSDLICQYICRILGHMDANSFGKCVPVAEDPSITQQPFFELNSGYVVRSAHMFPKQGSKSPWRLYQNYFLDLLTLRYKGIEDTYLTFSGSSDDAPGEKLQFEKKND